MGIVVSMLMITTGAIMRFAVTVQAEGWNVHTAGVVLMLVGALGAVLSIAFWASWGGFGGGRRTRVISSPTVLTGQRTTLRETEVL